MFNDLEAAGLGFQFQCFKLGGPPHPVAVTIRIEVILLVYQGRLVFLLYLIEDRMKFPLSFIVTIMMIILGPSYIPILPLVGGGGGGGVLFEVIPSWGQGSSRGSRDVHRRRQLSRILSADIMVPNIE